MDRLGKGKGKGKGKSKSNKAPNAYASMKASNEKSALKHIIPPSGSGRLSLDMGAMNGAVCFLAKVVALEATRRISSSRCPAVWNAVQALQLLSYPPFKWAQRWTPLAFLIRAIQSISKPLLLISVTTALVDHSKHVDTPNDTGDDVASTSATPLDLDTEGPEVTTQDMVAENWLVQLFKELEKQQITLPERFDKGELERFNSAANGELSVLVSSIKKSIRWRENYRILSIEELEMWSHLVFWHGYDVMLRPCLVIRFGYACAQLAPRDRPRFAQAVVSQIEHGIMNLVKEEEPTISVLMDCKGASPLRFPMQMLRTMTTIVQDNYPNRLARLLIIRLPPVVRVITHTFMQILKPVTRQKTQLEGEAYHKALTEFLQTIPAFLGGDCKCLQCRKILGNMESKIEEICTSSTMQPAQENVELEVNERVGLSLREMEMESRGFSDCNHVLRSMVLGLLVLCLAIAFLAGINEPDLMSLPL